MRIGRQIAHFEQVDPGSVKAIFSKDQCFRYLLSLKFQNSLMDRDRDKTAIVILKNPSAANEKMADATIRKVETYIYHSLPDVRNLHILNIFAIRATDPTDLNNVFSEKGSMHVIGEENDRVIKTTAHNADYIILAWGNNSGIDKQLYEERVFRIKQLLALFPASKVFVVKGSQKTVQPLHGLMWGYHYKLLPAGEYLNER